MTSWRERSTPESRARLADNADARASVWSSIADRRRRLSNLDRVSVPYLASMIRNKHGKARERAAADPTGLAAAWRSAMAEETDPSGPWCPHCRHTPCLSAEGKH